MRHIVRMALGASLLIGGLVVVAATPAGAAVVTTSSTTIVTVTVTGDFQVNFGCAGGDVTVNQVAVVPAVTCAALTRVNVNGDSGVQRVFGYTLDSPSFTNHPSITAHLGDGVDFLGDTLQADTIDMGPGDDWLFMYAGGVANTSTTLGTGSNTLQVNGRSLDDTITATSTTSSASVQVQNSDGTHTYVASPVTQVWLVGGEGKDVINATGITAASTVDNLVFDAGPGAGQTLTTGVVPADFEAEDGSATMTGSPGADQFHTASTADVIHGNGGHDLIYDDCCGPTGSRAVDTTGTLDWYDDIHGADAVARIRPGVAANSATLAVSLNRTGITQWSGAVTSAGGGFGYSGVLGSRNLFDAVLPTGAKTMTFYGDNDNNDIADITVPSGSWTVTGTAPGPVTITPGTSAYGSLRVNQFATIEVHGPWANKNQGFAHRMTRDLLFKFPTDEVRDSMRDELTAGSRTRAQLVQATVFSDEYRGIDVDRIFRRFLKRASDPSGRTYWVNGIRNGKSLRKVRAQLFGSNEYFTKAGSYNQGFVDAAYQDVLGRLPDPSGEAYWVHKIDTGTGRGSVANAFLVSTEARRSIVKDQFIRFLDRVPTTAETDSWMATLLSSATGEQDLIAFLASSGPYYASS